MPLRLTTERLILRAWRATDIDALVSGLGDLAVSQWLASVPHPYTRRHAAAWIAHCESSARAKPRRSYEFAIALRADGTVIGGVSLDRVDRTHGTAGGGIWIAAAHWGHGYGTEAFAARLAFAFDTLGLRRIENGYFTGNRASRAMLLGLGYKREGVARERFRCMADGTLKDEVQMALLRADRDKGRAPSRAHRTG